FVALKTYGRRIEEMVVKEPVAIKVAFGENPKTVYNERKMAPSTRMATAAILRESLMKAKEYKEMTDKYNSNPDENDKPEYDMKMEALLKVLNGEIPIKAHAHRADDILTAIRIAKEFDVDITLDHCTEGHLIVDYLKQENAKVIVGPLFSERSKIELRNMTFKAPGILSKAGIKVAMMTDHPVIPEQHLAVCAAIAVREGMDEMEALKSITINAAEITGIADRVGSLEAGKDADIVIYDGHPLDFRTKAVWVFVNGEAVKKPE
ncbi:MAG TPA: amidohydrolase family protein, partial [Candidatus Atribacteria bacterium]|nr:amidohydrolase family protein [Candidatus Atribacteria bacterium]